LLSGLEVPAFFAAGFPPAHRAKSNREKRKSKGSKKVGKKENTAARVSD
jgi:hypothetical protein